MAGIKAKQVTPISTQNSISTKNRFKSLRQYADLQLTRHGDPIKVAKQTKSLKLTINSLIDDLGRTMESLDKAPDKIKKSLEIPVKIKNSLYQAHVEIKNTYKPVCAAFRVFLKNIQKGEPFNQAREALFNELDKARLSDRPYVQLFLFSLFKKYAATLNNETPIQISTPEAPPKPILSSIATSTTQKKTSTPVKTSSLSSLPGALKAAAMVGALALGAESHPITLQATHAASLSKTFDDAQSQEVSLFPIQKSYCLFPETQFRQPFSVLIPDTNEARFYLQKNLTTIADIGTDNQGGTHGGYVDDCYRRIDPISGCGKELATGSLLIRFHENGGVSFHRSNGGVLLRKSAGSSDSDTIFFDTNSASIFINPQNLSNCTINPKLLYQPGCPSNTKPKEGLPDWGEMLIYIGSASILGSLIGIFGEDAYRKMKVSCHQRRQADINSRNAAKDINLAIQDLRVAQNPAAMLNALAPLSEICIEPLPLEEKKMSEKESDSLLRK